jgi:uncharacterized protein YuzE
MKKFILILGLGMLSFSTYADNTENKITVKLSENNCVEEVTNVENETFLSVEEVGKVVRVTITVDCDGDGEADYVYSGNMDINHISAQVDMMIAAC